MKKRQYNEGITLVALVVTIIVLLILAGVSIGLIFNGEGLFIKANDAASRYNQAKEDEADFLNRILGNHENENPDITPGGGDDSNKEESSLVLSETSGEIIYPNTRTFEITENTSNGILSVSSSDDSIASASIEGTTVTITPKAITESEKEVVITVRSAETEKYKSQTAIYVATVKKGGITIVAVPNIREYTGTPFDSLSSVTVTPEDATVEYSLNGGDYQREIPKITNVGTYTIAIKAEKEGYITKEETITVTVSKQSSTTGNLTLSETSGTITYPNTKTVNITNNKSNGKLSVTSSNESVATASISNNQIIITPKAITSSGQTSTITVTSAATSNYERQTATYIATVNQGTIFISATGYNGACDGSSHNAIENISITPSDATKTYSLNGGAYSSTIPTIKDEGTYTVKIKATKPGYKDNEVTRTATIKEAVARIASVYYSTLQQAVNAVPTTNIETTVTLLKNVTELVTVTGNRKVTLDLGDYWITGTLVNSGGNVNVNGGRIRCDGEFKTSAIINSSGSLHTTCYVVSTVTRTCNYKRI